MTDQAVLRRAHILFSSKLDPAPPSLETRPERYESRVICNISPLAIEHNVLERGQRRTGKPVKVGVEMGPNIGHHRTRKSMDAYMFHRCLFVDEELRGHGEVDEVIKYFDRTGTATHDQAELIGQLESDVSPELDRVQLLAKSQPELLESLVLSREVHDDVDKRRK